MIAIPRRSPELVHGTFRGTDAVRAGLVTRDELRGPGWRKLFRDVYGDATLAWSHERRCHAAGRYVLPGRAAIAGRSAALLWGAGLVGDDDPVEVVTPWSDRFGPVSGLRIHVSDLPEGEVRVVDGLRRTTPERTCWDLAQWLSLPEAVVHLDLLLAAGVVDAAGLRSYLDGHAPRRGWRRFERAVGLADQHAGSVEESRLRVRLVLAGLPNPVSRPPLPGRGPAEPGEADHKGIGLAWPHQKVAVRTGVDRVVNVDGWIVLHVSSRRLRDDFGGFVAQVRSALRTRSR